jgi:NAD(P)H dehydrogenase (quinone)
MKHLVIAAHPNVGSFTMSVARAYAEALDGIDHETLTCDLYRMDFNPVLGATELAGPGSPLAPPADVAWEQGHVRSAGALAFIYPLWWASMPAIMKGYIDRVFAYGFAYDFQGNTLRGLLTGHKAVIVTISAAPLGLLKRSGDWDALQALQDAHIFRASGLELLEHLHFGEVVAGMSEARGTEHLARVRALAHKHFGSVPRL